MERLQRWLEESGKTQAQLAELMHVSQPSVCDWINGKAFPRMKHLRVLSQRTGIPIEELLDASPRRKRANA